MAVNVNEAITKIKRVGASNVRCVPMPNQNVATGDYQIEINESNQWVVVATGLKKKIADDIITQATNKVILG